MAESRHTDCRSCSCPERDLWQHTCVAMGRSWRAYSCLLSRSCWCTPKCLFHRCSLHKSRKFPRDKNDGKSKSGRFRSWFWSRRRAPLDRKRWDQLCIPACEACLRASLGSICRFRRSSSGRPLWKRLKREFCGAVNINLMYENWGGNVVSQVEILFSSWKKFYVAKFQGKVNVVKIFFAAMTSKSLLFCFTL